MRGRVAVYEWGALVAARFLQGSVVLDARSKSIFELAEPAAIALDVLADRAGWPAGAGSTESCAEVREVLPLVRRELLGEHALAPGEGVTVEGRRGLPLLRRFAEPAQWRAARGLGARPLGSVDVSAAMVRTGEGVLVIVGDRRDVEQLAGGIVSLSADAAARDVVTIELLGSGSPRVRSRVWAEPAVIHEVWILAPQSTDNLVLARLGHARALVALLAAVRTRPDPIDVRALATTCLAIPHFRATVPRTARALAATMRSYGALS